jgi:hypothetical protein
VNDITPEALSVQLAANGERLLFTSDELGEWAALLQGKYSDGKSAGLDVVLKSFVGTPVEVFRVTRDPILLAAPLLSVQVMSQRRIFGRVFGDVELSNRGVSGRFLLGVPPRPREFVAEPPPVPSALVARYREFLMTLLAAPKPDSPREVGLTDGARELLHSRRRADFERQQDADRLGGDEGEDGWIERMPGHALRLAVVLGVAELGGADRLTVIDAGRLARAFALVDHSDVIRRQLADVADARRDLALALRILRALVARRDDGGGDKTPASWLCARFKGRGDRHPFRVDDLEPGLDILHRHGAVRVRRSGRGYSIELRPDLDETRLLSLRRGGAT